MLESYFRKGRTLSTKFQTFSYLHLGWQFGASSGEALCRRQGIQIVTLLGGKRSQQLIFRSIQEKVLVPLSGELLCYD